MLHPRPMLAVAEGAALMAANMTLSDVSNYRDYVEIDIPDISDLRCQEFVGACTVNVVKC